MWTFLPLTACSSSTSSLQSLSPPPFIFLSPFQAGVGLLVVFCFAFNGNKPAHGSLHPVFIAILLYEKQGRRRCLLSSCLCRVPGHAPFSQGSSQSFWRSGTRFKILKDPSRLTPPKTSRDRRQAYKTSPRMNVSRSSRKGGDVLCRRIGWRNPTGWRAQDNTMLVQQMSAMKPP